MADKFKVGLVATSAILFSTILLGIFYFFVAPTELVSLPLAYAAGLSMIFLPCTLPLVFVIVPLALRESPRKALAMSLLFGLGLVITITLYGIFAAFLGGIFNLQTANIIFLTIGGVVAYVFGLSELGLIKFTGPVFHASIPGFIRQRSDYAKTFFMGLLLGNIGVGCPNPAFYVLLSYIAASGSFLVGTSLGFIHAVGRATPLIFLAILAIIGVDATRKISAGSRKFHNWLGWSLVILGAVILLVGGPFKPWYEESPLHDSINEYLLLATGGKIGEQGEEHVFEVPFIPQWIAPYVFIALILIPILWNRFYNKEVGNERSSMRPGSA